MRGVLPEPIRDHFVVIDRRRYPPKQVLSTVTGLDRADFTTHHARRILNRLGFPTGRRLNERTRTGPPPSATPIGSHPPARASSSTPRSPGGHARARPTTEALEPFIGQWVATLGPAVLVGADEPGMVVRWLAEHDQQADGMFRVPGDEFEASGLAPR